MLSFKLRIARLSGGNISYIYDATGIKLSKTISTGNITYYAGNYVYEGSSLKFFNHPEGYIEPVNPGNYGSGFKYVYQYKDHLGNIRLSYTDSNNNGSVTSSEILEENNYYPFGLKHKGYNNNPTSSSIALKYKYGNKELQDELGLNTYDFGSRSYDPAIARWTSIDPVTHFNQSTYAAFDNNPVYFADPSGTTTVSSITEAWNATPEGGSSTWNSDGEGGFCDDCPQEGETRDSKKVVGSGAHSFAVDAKQYYHKADDKWYFEDQYYEKFRTTIRRIGQGQASIEILGSYNFTDDVLLKMASWAMSASDYYGGQIPKALGNIEEDNIIFELLLLKAPVSKIAGLGKMSFWSGRGTEAAARRAGFGVLGGTNAGKNLTKLTARMGEAEYKAFWDRLSAALAGSYKPGSTAHVYLSKSFSKMPAFQNSTWMRIEKDILTRNGVNIKYHWTK